MAATLQRMDHLKERARAAAPRAFMRARALKQWHHLPGLAAPASALTRLVPRGGTAIDAGANLGSYAYWIARRAWVVHAFEPNPHIFAQMAREVPGNVVPHNCGLSDREGTALLHIPAGGHGEASLEQLDGPLRSVPVRLRTLDAFVEQTAISTLSFIKIDVEGHEESLLAGAQESLMAHKPLLFIEIEERHNAGGLKRISESLGALGYYDQAYLKRGQVRALTDFDPDRDQAVERLGTPEYVHNFIFRGAPRKEAAQRNMPFREVLRQVHRD